MTLKRKDIWVVVNQYDIDNRDICDVPEFIYRSECDADDNHDSRGQVSIHLEQCVEYIKDHVCKIHED